MLKETARVINTDYQYAWLHTDRKTACGNCSAGKGCGVSLIDRMFSPGQATIRIRHENSLVIGDQVEIGINETAFLRSSLLVYLIPVLTMLFFALLGQYMHPKAAIASTIVAGSGAQSVEMASSDTLLLANEVMPQNETAVIAYALAGLLIGFYCVYITSKKLAKNADYHAVLIRKLEN